MRFEELLVEKRAHRTFIQWVGSRSIEQAWAECERGDWMLELLGRMAGTPGWPTREQVVLMACDCAETALRFVPEGENRPKQAIIDARRWANGEDISLAHLRDAANAAADAADAAYAGYSAVYCADSTYATDVAEYKTHATAYGAADAAYAAHAAAYTAVDPAYASHAASYAASADAYAYRYKKFRLRELADLIRPRFTPVSEHLGLER